MTDLTITPADLGHPVQQESVSRGAHAAETAVVDSRDLAELPGVGDVDLVTASAPAAPKITQAADGTYHLVLTWTKATKAHVGTAVAAVVGGGEFATLHFLPEGSPYTAWCTTALAAVGLVGIWLGVYLPSNKAKSA